QRKELEAVEDAIVRILAIMNRLIPKAPHDPALHHEMGTILLMMGKDKLALHWLHSALREDPEYRPAHEALADYYNRAGDAAQAARHRALASGRQSSGATR